MTEIQPATPFSILPTKFIAPQPQAHLVWRNRLLKEMNTNIGKKLTLISAPAGYGKTTLLAQWISQLRVPVIWYAVDELDNDLHRFLLHLAHAMNAKFPDQMVPLMRLASAPRGTTRPFLTLFIELLSGLEGTFLLVLDDLHQVNLPEIYESLEFLVEHAPHNSHFVISTREDPRMNLARLRANRQMIELRAHDLQFQADEAAQLINAQRGKPLATAETRMLQERTEGWCAGLQIAALTLQTHPDPSRLIREFSSSNRYVMDFFIEEVWQRQTKAVQNFLLLTSILDRLNASLCEAVTGYADSQQMLDTLERANLFLLPLDLERNWYRYHNLFAGLLQKRLIETSPEEVSSLHRKASKWYLQHDEISLGIQHALKSGDHAYAAGLIQEHAEAALMKSHTMLVQRWIGSIPRNVVMMYPKLGILHAWTLLMMSRPLREIEDCLVGIEFDTHNPLHEGLVLGLYAMLASMQGNIPAGLQQTQAALDIMPPDSILFRSILVDNLGILHLLHGNDRQALEAFQEAYEIGRKTENALIAVGALSNTAGLYLARGKLCDAKHHFERALKESKFSPDRYLPIASKPMIGLGDLLREQNDIENAEAYLTRGIELAQLYGEIGSIMGYLSLARIREAQYNLEAADKIMEEAQRLSRQFDSSQLDDRLVDSYRCLLWQKMGKMEKVIPWKRKMEQRTAQITPQKLAMALNHDPLTGIELISLAKIYLAEDQPEKSMQLLNQILPKERNQITNRSVVRGLVLQAIALQKLGENEQALTVFSQSVKLAEQEGYVRAFLDEGEPVKAMLAAAHKNPETASYADYLIRSWQESETQSKQGKTIKGQDLLTPREMDVLKLIAKGYTNKQIASTLFLALDTVKGYTRRLYTSLDAQNRADAIRIARKLGILTEKE